MGYTLRRLAVLALAAAASSQQTPPANVNQPFEVDTVFPRPIMETLNEEDMVTFKANEIIPLVIAVQNMTAWTVDNRPMLLEWYIMSVTAEGERGRIVDAGVFDTADAVDTNPAFLVAVTNSSTWYQNTTEWSVSPKNPGDKYLFQWSASLYANNDSCYFQYPRIPDLYAWNTASVFDVLTEAEEEVFNGTTAAVAIPQAPECPGLSGVYQATFNETATECQLGVVEAEAEANQGSSNPCAAQVDGDVASSISSRVASLTEAWNAPPATETTAPATSTSSGGVGGVAYPVQTAMAAAACLLCGLALS